MKKPPFDYSSLDTLRSYLIGLEKAREEKNTYVIANVVGTLHHRFKRFDIKLTKQERRRLIAMLRSARYGTPPLAGWIPRGYQIARLLMLTMHHMPRKTRVTSRDINLIFQAEAILIRDKKKWVSDQLGSLRETCRAIGLSHLF